METNEKIIDLNGLVNASSKSVNYTNKKVSEKADKPIAVTVIIPTEGWSDTGNTDYLYCCDIPIDGITSAHRAEIWFTGDSETAAKACGFDIDYAPTFEGYVQIRAKNIPDTIMTAEVQVGVLSARGVIHIGAESGYDDDIDKKISEHNTDTTAHPDIRKLINELRGRITALEVAAGGEVSSNTFAVTFGDLEGITVNGVWVPLEARLEF